MGSGAGLINRREMSWELGGKYLGGVWIKTSFGEGGGT